MVVADVAAHILLLVNLFDLQHCHDGLALVVGENEETGRQHIMMAATNVIIAKIVIMVDLLNSMMYGKRYNYDGWCGSVVYASGELVRGVIIVFSTLLKKDTNQNNNFK